MTHVEARKWIKRLPEGRGQALDAGAKAVLQELWDRVDWSIQHDTDGRECYPSRRRLAEDTGATVDVVKRRLATLAAAGWIRRERDGWALAWARPFEVELVTRSAKSVTPVAEHAQHPGHSTPRPRPLDSPHTKSEPSHRSTQ